MRDGCAVTWRGVCEVAGELFAQLQQPTGVGVAERRIGRHRERSPRGSDPGCSRERAEIGHARPQVEARHPLRVLVARRSGLGVWSFSDPRAGPVT